MDLTFGIAAVVAAAAVAIVLFGTLSAPRSCPRCGGQLPRIRKPTSISQLLWGGWKCPTCGCEIDRSGNPISNRGG
jgi:hypothetical protein